MKKLSICFILLWLIFSPILSAQEKPLQLSIGTIKTALKQNAIDFGIKYIQSYDSLLQRQDKLWDGDKSLLQLSPQFNVQSGTSDAFSSIDVKLSGLFMIFQTTEVAGITTPCTNCYMHLIPVNFGVETNNSFSIVNGIFEVGYVPWYQSPMMKNIPDWLKHTKAGVFLQAGYKFGRDTTSMNLEGGQTDESLENADSGIFRLKGSFAIDTKSLIRVSLLEVGLWGSADAWYDILNNEIYYRLEGTIRFFLSENMDKFFSLNYQKGSGAPNFNQGDQFGMGLTISF
ncbi:MAG TPA: hypothetical protein PK335_14245 [Draconibacterium sp.]|nr:hypothetical protein [Draconibacterium sp.]